MPVSSSAHRGQRYERVLELGLWAVFEQSVMGGNQAQVLYRPASALPNYFSSSMIFKSCFQTDPPPHTNTLLGAQIAKQSPQCLHNVWKAEVIWR